MIGTLWKIHHRGISGAVSQHRCGPSDLLYDLYRHPEFSDWSTSYEQADAQQSIFDKGDYALFTLQLFLNYLALVWHWWLSFGSIQGRLQDKPFCKLAARRGTFL